MLQIKEQEKFNLGLALVSISNTSFWSLFHGIVSYGHQLYPHICPPECSAHNYTFLLFAIKQLGNKAPL